MLTATGWPWDNEWEHTSYPRGELGLVENMDVLSDGIWNEENSPIPIQGRRTRSSLSNASRHLKCWVPCSSVVCIVATVSGKIWLQKTLGCFQTGGINLLHIFEPSQISRPQNCDMRRSHTEDPKMFVSTVQNIFSELPGDRDLCTPGSTRIAH
jgi:hypothetical protein